MSNLGLLGLPQGQRSSKTKSSTPATPATPGSIEALIPVGNTPYSLTYVQSTNRIYVGNYVDHTVSVINPATNLVVATFGVQTAPFWLCTANERSGVPYVYVVHDQAFSTSALTRITASDNTVTSLTSVSLNRPGGICGFNHTFTSQFIVCDTYSNQARIFNGAGTLNTTFSTGIGPVSPCSAGGGSHIFIANNNPSSNSATRYTNDIGQAFVLFTGLNRPNGIAYDSKRDTAVLANTNANQLIFIHCSGSIGNYVNVSVPNNPVMPCFVPSTASIFVSVNTSPAPRIAILSDDIMNNSTIGYTDALPVGSQPTQMIYVPTVNRVYAAIPNANGLVACIVPKGV